MDKCCETCKFSTPTIEDKLLMYCNRYPPINSNRIGVGAWPVLFVNAKAWCGEFKEKQPQVNDKVR